MKKILLSLFLCFAFMGNVFAEEINFELKSSNLSNEIIKGNYANINLVLNSVENNYDLGYCTFEIESSEGFEFKEVQALNSFTISDDDNEGNILNISVKNHQESLFGAFNILNIKYLVNETGSLKINSLTCNSQNGESLTDIKYNEDLLTFNVVDNAKKHTLKSLKINGGELNPQFTPMTFSYNVNNFISNTLSLEYEVTDPSYQDQVVVTVNGKEITDLNNIPYEVTEANKVMLITIIVGNDTEYNIFVYKELNNSLDSYLNSITINNENLELVSGKYDYVYTVSDDVKTVDIAAELKDNENFRFGTSSNIPASFDMTGKVTAIINVESTDSLSGIPSVTYTVTVVNESYNPDVDDNPKTADTSMYVMALILLLSLVGSTVLYKKNLNAYK